MNRNEFNRFIAGDALPGPGDLEGLRELIALFPWFHSAHMVLLRGLRENADIRFDAQLKASALSVNDREMLYHYLFMHPAVEVAHEETPVEAVAQAEVEHEEVAQPEAVREETAVEIMQETAVQEVSPTPVAEESTERTREELMAEIEARLEELTSPAKEEISPAPGEAVPDEKPKEEIIQENVAQPEAVHEETAHEETVVEEIVEEEAAQTEVVQEEVAQEEAAPGETVREEVAQTEVVEEKVAQEEAATGEAVHEEVAQTDVVEEAAVQEPAQAPVVEESPERTRQELMAEIEARLEELASQLKEEFSPAPEEVPEPENVTPPVAEESAATVKEELEPESEELLELIEDNGPFEPEPVKQLSPQDLIDRFIRSSPTLERIPLPETQPVMDMSKSGTEETGTFITETLAKIYLNQGYYSKAINIYETLSLQFPEKSAYFASRIEKIKDLIK